MIFSLSIYQCRFTLQIAVKMMHMYLYMVRLVDLSSLGFSEK